MKATFSRRMIFAIRDPLLAVLVVFGMTHPTLSYAQWQHCNGLYGGSIRALGGNSNVLFASSQGGLYKSFDEGSNWQFTSYGLASIKVDKLAVSGNTVIVSTVFDGIYISYDLGNTWQMLPNTTSNDELAGAFVVNNRIFISLDWNNTSMPDPLYKSDDNGFTWQSVSTGLQGKVEDHTLLGNDIYIATSKGVYVSSDSGISWQPRNNGLPVTSTGNTGWTDHIITLGNALVAVSDAEPGVPTPSLMVTVDSGLSWQTYDTIGSGSISFLNDIFSIGNKLIASTGYGLHLSLDTGRTWVDFNNGILQGSNTSVQVMVKENGKLYIGTSKASLLCSIDTGQTWTPCYNGIMGINYGAVGYFANKLFASPTYTKTALISTDQGNTWDTINPIFNNRITEFETRDSTIIAGANFPNILLSRDGGNSWAWGGPFSIGVGDTKFHDILIDPPNIFLLNTMGTYRSPDNGLSWVSITGFFSETATAITRIGTRYVLVTEGDGVYYSDDNGSTWHHTVSGIPFSSLPFYLYTGMYGIEEKDGLLFAGTYDDGVLISADSGVNWSISSNGLPVTYMGYIYCMTHDSAKLYVGSIGHGVYFSPDNAQNWYPCNLGLPSNFVYYLVKAPDLLLASTSDNGLWKLNTQSIGVNRDTPGPRDADILQIYPNPITPASEIYLPGNHHAAQLFIYDITGKALVRETFKGNSLPIGSMALRSGIYIVKVVTDGKVFTRKILVD